jgi:processive 1,2-diacylglycerol beta-glucosyltransferase
MEALFMSATQNNLTSNLFADLRPSTACDFHRVVLPYEHMQRTTMPQPKVPVYWCNRMPTGGYAEMIQKKREGYRVVIDIDDHWLLDEGHYLYDRFRKAGVNEVIPLCLKEAAAVIVTTPHLASQVRKINRNVVVIPNALPYDEGQFTRSQDRESDTPFIWAGGASHREDLKLLPQSPELTIAGVRFDDSEWKKILGGIKAQKIKPAMRLAEYMRLYDGHKASLAPLVDTAFNRCKSNLKMLEAGAKGLAFIASKVRPYFNEVDCDHVLYAESAHEFSRKMKALAAEKNQMEDYQCSLAEHVRLNYHLTDANELRRQLFESFS